MVSMIFDTCCGCIELRSGCLIIGYIHLITVIGVIVASILGFSKGMGPIAALKITESNANYSEEEADVVVTIAVIYAVVFVILLSLFLIMAILYLVGIHKDKKGLVQGYLIFSVIFLVILAIMIFVSVFHTAFNSAEVIDVVVNILYIILKIYFLLVIRSYYCKMGGAEIRPVIFSK